MAAWKMDAPQEMSPPRLSLCHPSWASDGSADNLHMFVHSLKLLGTLLFIGVDCSAATTGNSGRGPSGMKLMVRYMYWACRRGERVLARVLAVGSSCRTGAFFV